jgi:hypothetical protein
MVPPQERNLLLAAEERPYIISSYGARKGLVDPAKSTVDSGLTNSFKR